MIFPDVYARLRSLSHHLPRVMKVAWSALPLRVGDCGAIELSPTLIFFCPPRDLKSTRSVAFYERHKFIRVQNINRCLFTRENNQHIFIVKSWSRSKRHECEGQACLLYRPFLRPDWSLSFCQSYDIASLANKRFLSFEWILMKGKWFDTHDHLRQSCLDGKKIIGLFRCEFNL